jgi:hypothetical protein
MNYGLLSPAVAEVWVVTAVKKVKHNRARTEVEGNTIAHTEARPAIQPQSEPTLLDVTHSDRRSCFLSTHHHSITVEAATVPVRTPDEFKSDIDELEKLIGDFKAASDAAEAARPQMKPKK